MPAAVPAIVAVAASSTAATLTSSALVISFVGTAASLASSNALGSRSRAHGHH